MFGRLNLLNGPINSIALSVQTAAGVFVETDMPFLKFSWKKTKNNHDEKNKGGRHALSDSKTY